MPICRRIFSRAQIEWRVDKRVHQVHWDVLNLDVRFPIVLYKLNVYSLLG